MTNDKLAEICIESLKRCTPEQLREIRDSIRLKPFKDEARKKFHELQYNLIAKPN
jgi:hypothetical protein